MSHATLVPSTVPTRVDDLKTRENPWRRRLARAGGVLAGTLVGGLEIICAATRAASPRSPAFVILGSPRRHGEAW